MNLIYFSEYIAPTLKRIKFLLILCGRFLKMLFKLKKSIKLLYFDYSKNHQFDNSYLIIRYRFTNALWYTFKKIKTTTDNEPIILDIRKISFFPIELTVYGFFRKKSFFISISPENKLITTEFKTKIKNISKTIIGINELQLIDTKPTLLIKKIKHTNKATQIKQSSFNKIDFI